MVQKINTTEQEILKKILNYDFSNPDEMILLTSIYALSKMNINESPHGNLDISKANIPYNGLTNLYNGKVKYPKKIFLDSQSYAKELVSVFHETTHTAQSLDNSKINFFYINYNRISKLYGLMNLPQEDVLHYNCYTLLPPSLKETINYDEINSKITQTKKEFYTNYYLQDYEVDARESSFEIANKMINEMKTLNLSPQEMETKEKLEKDIKSLHHDNSMNYILFSQDLKDSKNSIKIKTNQLRKNYGTYLQSYRDGDVDAINDLRKTYGEDILFTLSETLAYNFDERTAQDYFNIALNLYNSTDFGEKTNDIKQYAKETLRTLYLYTPMKIDEQTEGKYNDIIDDFNGFNAPQATEDNQPRIDCSSAM